MKPHLIIVLTMILSTCNHIFGSDSVHALLVSKMNTNINLVCDSNKNNKPITWLWKGSLIYKSNRTDPNQLFGNRLVMDNNFSPHYVLRLAKLQMSDTGEYVCQAVESDFFIKSLKLIVLESEPVGDMYIDSTNATVNAYCAITYAGSVTPSITWCLKSKENHCTALNATFNTTTSDSSSRFFNASTTTTATTITSNLSVIASGLEIGNILICLVQFELTNNNTATKYTFNWTSNPFCPKDNDIDCVMEDNYKLKVLVQLMVITFTAIIVVISVVRLTFFRHKINAGRIDENMVEANENTYSGVIKGSTYKATTVDPAVTSKSHLHYSEICIQSMSESTMNTQKVIATDHSTSVQNIPLYSEVQISPTNKSGSSTVAAVVPFYTEIQKQSTALNIM